jgi:hypothetical protein
MQNSGKMGIVDFTFQIMFFPLIDPFFIDKIVIFKLQRKRGNDTILALEWV